jgi:hypothetical protein
MMQLEVSDSSERAVFMGHVSACEPVHPPVPVKLDFTVLKFKWDYGNTQLGMYEITRCYRPSSSSTQ